MEYVVNIKWDSEASVWMGTSDTVKGLVLESGSVDALIERVRYAVPELLTLNNVEGDISETSICFLLERHEKVHSIMAEYEKRPNKITDFFDEINKLCKKFNLSISHEDSEGAFIIEKYNLKNIAWLKCANKGY